MVDDMLSGGHSPQMCRTIESTRPGMNDSLERSRGVREQYVAPLYLSLLHANFAHRRPYFEGHSDTERVAVCTRIARAATTISDEQIAELLSEPDWRGRLVAGWFVGLSRRVSFIDRIASLLLASQQTYAGQGYCIALALIGNDECRKYLRNYLSQYLPIQGRFYDQEWAIGALAYIEGIRPQEFLLPELWAEAQGRMNPSDAIERFSELVAHLDNNHMRVVA